jgi:hypothetical protein
VEPTQEELGVLECGRRAWLDGDRESWVATFDPAATFEFLADWPGTLGVEGPEAAWDQYVGFMAEFEQLTFEELNIERLGRFTIFDLRCELLGRTSGVPMELHWTFIIEFDPTSHLVRSSRMFHTRDEAIAAAAKLNGLTQPL